MKKKLNSVLLVDDDASDNFLHRRVIENAKIADRIEVAKNGKEALKLLTTEGYFDNPDHSCSQPELIFLDINMPVMDGWEFLDAFSKLKNIEKEKTVIVILTTSLNPADKTRAEKLIACGCFQYKPLTLDIINGILRNRFPDYL